jgi:hypothetical protein
MAQVHCDNKCKELDAKISESSGFPRLTVGPREYAQCYSASSGGYGHLASKILAAETHVQSVSKELVFLFNQYLVATLLGNFRLDDSCLELPESIARLYPGELQRIAQQLEDTNLEFYQLGNDVLLKDLAILSHRLVPVGAEFVCPGSGVPRSLIFKRGFGQFCGGIRACLVQAGGFKPYFELHAHTLSLGDFNPEGWLKTYARTAELLEFNPEYLGVISTSWFLDPALSSISPHLAYLRAVPMENGATMLFAGYDSAGTSGALATSSSRRRLFESGRYTPALYTRIWPRSKLIGWLCRGRRNTAA